MRRLGLLVLPALILAVAGLAAGCTNVSVECSLGLPPNNPVDVSGGAYGRAVVIATVGEELGRTKISEADADQFAVTVDRVVAAEPYVSADDPLNRGAFDRSTVAALESVAAMKFSGDGCGGDAENATLETGRQVLLVLAARSPTDGPWTIGSASGVLDVAGAPGSELATWQHRSQASEGGCDGHLTFDLAALEAAFDEPALAPQPAPACIPD